MRSTFLTVITDSAILDFSLLFLSDAWFFYFTITYKIMVPDSDKTFTVLKMRCNQADNVHLMIEYFPSDIGRFYARDVKVV